MLKIQQRHVMKQQTLASTNKPNAQPPPLVSATGTPTKQEPSSTNGTVESVHSINRPEGHVSTSFLSIGSLNFSGQFFFKSLKNEINLNKSPYIFLLVMLQNKFYVPVGCKTRTRRTMHRKQIRGKTIKILLVAIPTFSDVCHTNTNKRMSNSYFNMHMNRHMNRHM